MISKGKVAAVIALFAAIGLITATGAFTTVTAERTATVSTAGDASALLAMEPYDGPNGENYAELSDGTLELHLDGSANDDSDATGVNLNALTEVDNVFTVTNQGTQDVAVWITKNGTNEDLVSFYNGTHDSADRVAIHSQDDAQVLGVGNSMTVSMVIDTRGEDLGEEDELLAGITVNANAIA